MNLPPPSPPLQLYGPSPYLPLPPGKKQGYNQVFGTNSKITEGYYSEPSQPYPGWILCRSRRAVHRCYALNRTTEVNPNIMLSHYLAFLVTKSCIPYPFLQSASPALWGPSALHSCESWLCGTSGLWGEKSELKQLLKGTSHIFQKPDQWALTDNPVDWIMVVEGNEGEAPLLSSVAVGHDVDDLDFTKLLEIVSQVRLFRVFFDSSHKDLLHCYVSAWSVWVLEPKRCEFSNDAPLQIHGVTVRNHINVSLGKILNA